MESGEDDEKEKKEAIREIITVLSGSPLQNTVTGLFFFMSTLA